MLAGGAIGALAGPVRAEDFGLSPALQLVGWFGDDRLRFGIGLDLRAAWIAFGKDELCTDRESGGVGVFAQAMWMFGSARYTLGLHGGSEYGDRVYPAWDVEAGWTYRTAEPGHPAGHGLHVGALTTWEAFEFSIRSTFTFAERGTIAEGALGTGIRFPGPFHWGGYGSCAIGRPLRVAGDVRLADVVIRGPRRAARRLDPGARAALGRAWLDDARAEAASVPAFRILARDLAALGAPSSLIAWARRAASDEVRHARACADVAGEMLGLEVEPAAPPAWRPERPGLERLVIESWRDGCLAEGAAARRAACAAERARDPAIRLLQARIAREESDHAELAWAILGHALSADRRMRDVLAAELERPAAEPGPAPGPVGVDDRTWADQGRLDRPTHDTITHGHGARAVARAADLLAV
ncbi:MAG: hypothetical protein IT385_00740 [Deltaproteobacteria bacterium]|nr:hypothetical protein [Deltaproteobacteria bacterium]